MGHGSVVMHYFTVKCPLHTGLLIGVDNSPQHIYNSPEVVMELVSFFRERWAWKPPHKVVDAVAVKENSSVYEYPQLINKEGRGSIPGTSPGTSPKVM